MQHESAGDRCCFITRVNYMQWCLQPFAFIFIFCSSATAGRCLVLAINRFYAGLANSICRGSTGLFKLQTKLVFYFKFLFSDYIYIFFLVNINLSDFYINIYIYILSIIRSLGLISNKQTTIVLCSHILIG